MNFDNCKEYSLGDFADVQNGYAFKSADFTDKGIPVIKIKNISDSKVDLTDVRYYSSAVEKLSSFIIKKGDILISMTGSHINQIASAVGKVGRYQHEFPALLNQRVGKVFVKDISVADNDYLYYFLNRFETQFELASSAGGSANQANISPGQIKGLKVCLPPIANQRRIASILSSLDDKIELNRQINQTLEDIAQAIFKEWFVDFNFPGATGELVESELGMIPKGWRVGKLGDIYKTTSGGTPSRAKLEYYSNGTIPWIKSKELNNSFIIDTEEKITDGALTNSSAKLLPKHSVLIAMYGATVGQVGITGLESACNQAVCAFIPNAQYPYTFIYQFLKNNKADIISRAVGSAQQNISQDLLKRMEIILPEISVVADYNAIASSLLEKIESNLVEINTLTQLRDSLLPKLMNGEIIFKTKLNL